MMHYYTICKTRNHGGNTTTIIHFGENREKGWNI